MRYVIYGHQSHVERPGGLLIGIVVLGSIGMVVGAYLGLYYACMHLLP